MVREIDSNWLDIMESRKYWNSSLYHPNHFLHLARGFKDVGDGKDKIPTLGDAPPSAEVAYEGNEFLM